MIPPTFQLMMATIADMLNQPGVAYRFAGYGYNQYNRKIYIANVLRYETDAFLYRGEKFTLHGSCSDDSIIIDFKYDRSTKYMERKASYHSLITELKEYNKTSDTDYSSPDSKKDKSSDSDDEY